MGKRKTFHHIKQGDVLTVEHIRYPNGIGPVVSAKHTGCTVADTSARLILVDVPGENGGRIRFSKRSGCEWGAFDDWLRIHKQHAKRQE